MRKSSRAAAVALAGSKLGVALLGATLLVTTLLVALTGCVPQAVQPSATPHPVVTPVFKTDAEALAAAKAAYLRYLAVSDQILADGGTNPQRLLKVATRQVYLRQRPSYDDAHAKEWRGVGATKLDKIILESRVAPTIKAGVIVTVYACVDVADVNVINSSGISVVSPSRQSTTSFETSFELSASNSDRLLLSSEKVWDGQSICD